MTSNRERNELTSMHGLTSNGAPRNFRDASGSNTLWKNPPTIIATPVNQRTRSEAEKHDFSNRMIQNKQQKKPFGNVTSRRMSNYAPNKRQKLNTGAKREKPLPAIHFSDDDLTIHPNDPSTDDLNIVGDHLSFSPPSGSSSKPGPPLIVPDGTNTAWLERNRKYALSTENALGGPVKGEDSNDAIESDDIVELLVRPGIVKDRVTFLENARRTSIENPLINLKTGKKISNRIVNGMKPRGPQRKPPTLPEDDMTSSTPFRKSVNQNKIIPITDFFIGHRIYSEAENREKGRLFLKWGINYGLNILQRVPTGAPKSLASFIPSKHFVSMTYTEDPESCKNYVILKVGTRTMYDSHTKPDIPTTSLFKMGDELAGDLVFKFDDQDNDWSSVNYGLFIDWLKKDVDKVDLIRGYPAAKALWDEAERNCSFSESPNRKSHHSTSEESNVDFSDIRAVSRAPKRVLPENDVPFNTHALLRFEKSGSNTSNVPRRSLRNIATSTNLNSPARDADEVILVYPQGVPGAVNITNADLGRLQPGEFLNDTLIEFGLKYWHRELEISNPELAKDIHVFSSFFYKKLNKKKTEEGYDSVRKWTSKFDLFSKKYIIIPINENVHWYLAIIYEPEHILLPPPLPVTTPTTRKNIKKATSKKPLSRLQTEHVGTGNDVPVVPKETTPEAELAPSVSGRPDTEDALSCVDFQATVVISSNGMTTTKPGIPGDLVTVGEATSVNIDDASSPLSPLSDNMDFNNEGYMSRIPRASSLTASEMEIEHTALKALSRTVSSEPTDHKGMPIPPAQFYAQLVPNDKEMVEVHSKVTVEDDSENEVIIANEVRAPKTYIFTMDSLGSRHPQAVRQLARYLKLEAQDKKQLSEDKTSTAIGKVAPVPFQPNYCDCGIYLLHLARTFMTDPTGYCQKILETRQNMANEERQQVWNDHEVADIRAVLSDQIQQLSAEWKKERAAKEARKESKADPETVESSDDEIDIVETTIPTRSKGPTPRKKAAARLR
ncbi:hypothetical protein BDQ17DRAFT_1271073 [Cyathus striatus]|nr:hypothetical protein BDQ17DRAFT_1271073 [Cyathus striatus]